MPRRGPVFEDARKIYRESQKPADSLFNRYIARPPAAVVVAKLAPTRVTPNQVTFASIAIMKLAVLAFALVPTWAGLWLGVLLVEQREFASLDVGPIGADDVVHWFSVGSDHRRSVVCW